MNDYILTIHDEIVSNLILMNCSNVVYNDGYPSRIATIKGKRVDISLIATTDKYASFLAEMKKKYTKKKISESDDEILKNNYSLSAGEIVMYLILLHHYIVNQTDIATITIKQINKEYRQIKSMNNYLFDSYVKALEKLSRKKVHFNIKRKYVNNHKITNYSDTHKLLNVIELIPLEKDWRIVYDLGSLGRIIRDSKNYSTIIPKGIYSCKYTEISYLLLFLYISRMVFINRNQKRKRSPVKRLALRTICKNICKYNRQGYNMNISYENVLDNNVINAKKMEFNNEFYDLYADDYRVWNERKERYYLGLIDRNKKAINKCINKNRDLKMIIKHLRNILTILKDTHYIADFNLLDTSFKCEEDIVSNDWNHINGKNWDSFIIEILFLPNDTQSMKDNM